MNQPAQHRPAGVVSRVLAAAVDSVAVVAILAAGFLGVAGVRFVWSPQSFSWPTPPAAVTLQLMGVVAVIYLTVGWATIGRTYGGSLLGLRVLSSRRRVLGWSRAALRAVLCVVFPFGLVWAVVSRRRQSVQDIVVRSVVVYDWNRDGGRRAAKTADSSEPAVPR